jgi:hypothetical protein
MYKQVFIESCLFSAVNGCTVINNCVSAPCQHGGSCSTGINVFHCACPPGYTETICEQGRIYINGYIIQNTVTHRNFEWHDVIIIRTNVNEAYLNATVKATTDITLSSRSKRNVVRCGHQVKEQWIHTVTGSSEINMASHSHHTNNSERSSDI